MNKIFAALSILSVILAFTVGSQAIPIQGQSKQVALSQIWNRDEDEVTKVLGKPTRREFLENRKAKGNGFDNDTTILTYENPSSKISQLDIRLIGEPGQKGKAVNVIAWLYVKKASPGIWNSLGIVPETGGTESEITGTFAQGSYSVLLDFSKDPAFKTFAVNGQLAASVRGITGKPKSGPATQAKPDGSIFLRIARS